MPTGQGNGRKYNVGDKVQLKNGKEGVILAFLGGSDDLCFVTYQVEVVNGKPVMATWICNITD